MSQSYLKILSILTISATIYSSTKVFSQTDKEIIQEHQDTCFTYLDHELKSILNAINKEYETVLSKEMHILCALAKDDKSPLHIVNSESLLNLLHDFINIHKPNDTLKHRIEKYIKKYFPNDCTKQINAHNVRENYLPFLLLLARLQQLIKEHKEKDAVTQTQIGKLNRQIMDLAARLDNRKETHSDPTYGFAQAERMNNV